MLLYITLYKGLILLKMENNANVCFGYLTLYKGSAILFSQNEIAVYAFLAWAAILLAAHVVSVILLLIQKDKKVNVRCGYI